MLSDPPRQLTITLAEDATGKTAAALGYLHVNCGKPCHSSRGLGRRRSCSDAQRTTPGHHEQSPLWLLSHRRGDYQMPPLVRHRVDDAGTTQLSERMDALVADRWGPKAAPRRAV